MTYADKTGRKGGVLFTAGPISTSESVRMAQTVDYGSRDTRFCNAVKEVREMLLEVGGVSADEWNAIPMQGSGTMGVEASLSSIISRDPSKKVLVVRNGSYGVRIGDIVKTLGATLVPFDVEEGADMDMDAFEKALIAEQSSLCTIAIVHSETSTGIFNPIHHVFRLARQHCPTAYVFVDAMSSLGAVDMVVSNVADVIVSSANKCIQGIPGFSFVLARRSVLAECRGRSRSFSLDIVRQADGLDKTGQFNNTPPVQAIMAFHQALLEHKAEGGNKVRGDRYKAIANYIADEMVALGFQMFLDRTKPSFGYIITSYIPFKDPNWDFMTFYNKLNALGFVIYPGKASNADTFRIGSLGDITLDDAKALMSAARQVLGEMGVAVKA